MSLLTRQTLNYFWCLKSISERTTGSITKLNSHYKTRFLWLDGGTDMASRYFAMVLRATLIPFPLIKDEILLSLNGFAEFSQLINSWINARIAVDEHSPPSCVDTWLEKKYLNSNIPFGVCIYFWVVTREIVDSCISTATAISRSTSGFIAMGPKNHSKISRSHVRSAI